MMLKTRFPFLYASTSFDTKRKNNRFESKNFESCMSIRCFVWGVITVKNKCLIMVIELSGAKFGLKSQV